MRTDTDVLVIGAGPGGLWAAAQLARRGHDVVVCEEHTAIGEPVHCTGILAGESFDDFELPQEAKLNVISTVRFLSPSGLQVSYTPSSPLAIVIDRSEFDRALSVTAQASGARIRTGIRIAAVEPDAGGMAVHTGGETMRARLVILACGANYALQRRFGLGFPARHLHTAQRELRADRAKDVEVHIGSRVAPDGFAWVVPVERPDGLFARVGVMAKGDVLRRYYDLVDSVRERCGLEQADAPPRQKILPLGVIDRTYADRLLVVGDAAGLVKPTTGGGIHYSIVSAQIAAEVASDALAVDRLDAATLSEYETRWRGQLGEELEAQNALREVAGSLTDPEIDAFFELAQTDGIIPLVRATARFNEHRHLIRALFRHPPARRILFRTVVG